MSHIRSNQLNMLKVKKKGARIREVAGFLLNIYDRIFLQNEPLTIVT